jgi:hypothetical protein
MRSQEPSSDTKLTSASAGKWWWACEDLSLGPLPYQIPRGSTAMEFELVKATGGW